MMGRQTQKDAVEQRIVSIDYAETLNQHRLVAGEVRSRLSDAVFCRRAVLLVTMLVQG